MSKELEAMKSYDKIDNTLCLNNNQHNIEFAISEDENLDCKDAYEMIDCLDTIKQALQELQAIKNSNPSDAMECIKRIWDDIEVYNNFRQDFKDLKTIENYILKTQEQEKVLKIIFEKKIDMYMLNDLGTLEEYNEWVLKKYGTYYQLTQEEFNTLKEYFKDE